MRKTWWKESVVYQIYPRSFMDSNGDGIGDLQGIIQKLDYLHELGVDVVWLSPVYASPNDDNGYDISDYRAIQPEFGTMDDWEALLSGLHQRGMKLMMDLVVNHTSDEHAWFQQSRLSKDNPYRAYYFWRSGQGGREPNNWVSVFGGSAWQHDKWTDEYFLHLFSQKQPDLNWNHPKVRQEIYEMMVWWLDKGVDGFRMDVINYISKDDSLPGIPSYDGGYAWGGEYFANGPRIHEFLEEMNREVLSRYDMMTVGEMPGVTVDEAAVFANEAGTALQMVFQFDHMDLDAGPGGKWDVQPFSLAKLKSSLSHWQTGLDGRAWNSLYLNNHDQPRMVSRFGNDTVYRKKSAKMLATALHMLQGTPFIYQGEELGMTNVKFPSIDDYRDIETLNMYHQRVMVDGVDAGKVMASIHAKGRDNARTPMQWSSKTHGGFTSGIPWLKTNPNYDVIHAEEALRDRDSVFYFYQRLIQLRKQHSIIVYGSCQIYDEAHPHVYAYTRTFEENQLFVVCNFFDVYTDIWLPEALRNASDVKILLTNGDSHAIHNQVSCERLSLHPYDAVVYYYPL
ncbi:glucohydrolase [Paenibacillus selenitireducens]|uniref:oligo-1,6-glucosidase n=1 Tax=Paenibacillus selenitireducens TaxID=1324314 RepID=A0A1T2XFA9_9BACL|nr:alpha-glucosidase [Paenibacillus selenitireducens]OPA78540.1 glucohydrolase [Paenibacillus selenitireducens]